MSVLVDSSAWIDYFRNSGQSDVLELLIEEDLVVINELILAKLIPPLKQRRQNNLISLLQEVKCQNMSINWNEIIRMQLQCLSNGINGIGIPDLMIAQNAIQGELKLLSNDRHFILISEVTPLELFR